VVSCAHVTANEPPSGESGPGVASAVGTVLAKRPRKRSPEVPWSETAVALQAGSSIVPVWPLPVAVALVKVAVPKFASGSGRQPP